MARFGTLRWRGRAPRGAELAFSFRSGVSSEPDRTWSDWTAPRKPSATARWPLEGVPAGRYVQWRADAQGRRRRATASPQIDAVELTYRQENLRPKVTSFEVLDPGEILVPAGFNPTTQVFEPVHPNREGIFTTLEEARRRRRSPHQDAVEEGLPLVAVEGRGPERRRARLRPPLPTPGPGAAARATTGWLPVVEELDDDHFSFDATALPDGLYRFRLTVSDAGANAPGEGMVGDELSEPVVIDHSPPALVEAASARAGRSRPWWRTPGTRCARWR